MTVKIFSRVLIIILMVLVPTYTFATAIPNWPTFYDGFEDRTVNQEITDGTGGPFQEADINFAGQSAACTLYVRDSSNPDISETVIPRYGSKYLDQACTWSDTSLTSKGWGNYDFRREYIWFRGDELIDGGKGLNYNDGTEYWLSWAEYIPSDVRPQILESGGFQLHGDGRNIIYYTGSNTKLARLQTVAESGYTSCKENLYDRFDKAGEWIDIVMRLRLYTSDNANAKVDVWIDGVSVGNCDGMQNLLTGETGPQAIWQHYNWWATQASATSCSNVTYYTSDECNNTGVYEDYKRHFILDEIHIYEYESGQGDHYCDVAPPIWGAKPTISYPAQLANNIPVSFTALFDGYSDHHTEGDQNCYTAYQMDVQIDDTSNFSSLVEDNSNVSSSNQYDIGDGGSPLSENTTYYMRIRQCSYNSTTSTEYCGDWSDTRTFTTEPPAEAASGNPSIGGGTAQGGGTY